MTSINLKSKAPVRPFKLSLRFPAKDIRKIASLFSTINDSAIEKIAIEAQNRGYFTKKEFLKICHWKSPRTQPQCAENPEDFIREITRLALSTPNERLRIESLTLLKGVSWPTASAILHFASKDSYPILDFRALWSLGVDKPPPYNFSVWFSYTKYCRTLARKNKVDMRTLDRALWQYSKDNQPPG
jgi:hypothetical protein